MRLLVWCFERLPSSWTRPLTIPAELRALRFAFEVVEDVCAARGVTFTYSIEDSGEYRVAVDVSPEDVEIADKLDEELRALGLER